MGDEAGGDADGSGIGWDVAHDDGVGADSDSIADGDRTEDFRADTDEDVVANSWSLEVRIGPAGV